MGVAGQVLEHAQRLAKRALGIHDPLAASRGGQQLLKGAPLCQGRQLAVELELLLLISLTQQLAVLAAEHAAEDAHRQEVIGLRGDPALAVR